jgi:hypothetical protein
MTKNDILNLLELNLHDNAWLFDIVTFIKQKDVILNSEFQNSSNELLRIFKLRLFSLKSAKADYKGVDELVSTLSSLDGNTLIKHFHFKRGNEINMRATTSTVFLNEHLNKLMGALIVKHEPAVALKLPPELGGKS